VVGVDAAHDGAGTEDELDEFESPDGRDRVGVLVSVQLGVDLPDGGLPVMALDHVIEQVLHVVRRDEYPGEGPGVELELLLGPRVVSQGHHGIVVPA